jgi:hypothetical protein
LKNRSVAVPLIVGWVWVGGWCASASGDGGTVRLLERVGPYEIAVFTAPTPFRAGPVDLSVLVQDAATGEPVPSVRVTVTLAPRGRPGEAIRHPATTEAATNKLLHAALFVLPEPGWWEVLVQFEGPRGMAEVHFTVEAAEPAPRWPSLWPWLAWPAAAITLFGIHQFLVWRKSHSGRGVSAVTRRIR